MSNDWENHWGSAEWAAAQTSPRGRLEAEFIENVRRSQNATHQMDEAAARAMGISAGDARCLDIVDRRGRVSAGQIATEAGLSSGAVTGVIDRLEAKGYVRRVPDPGDRRRVLVEITDKQREEVQRLYYPLKEMADERFSRLSEEELRLLSEFHQLSAEINERRAAEIRAELEPESGG